MLHEQCVISLNFNDVYMDKCPHNSLLFIYSVLLCSFSYKRPNPAAAPSTIQSFTEPPPPFPANRATHLGGKPGPSLLLHCPVNGWRLRCRGWNFCWHCSAPASFVLDSNIRCSFTTHPEGARFGIRYFPSVTLHSVYEMIPVEW